MPIFVLFNGDVPFANFSIVNLFSTVPLAIILGLFLGKSLGAFSFAWVTIKLKWSRLPLNSNFWHLLEYSYQSIGCDGANVKSIKYNQNHKTKKCKP